MQFEDSLHYLIDDSGRGPVRAIDQAGNVTERFTVPADACELVTREQVFEEITEALEKVTLSKVARSAVEKMLEGLAS
jgi:hypothetical protein